MANPFSTTLGVWHAIFLREALDRLFGLRAAWMWLMVEPAMHICFMIFLRIVIRNRSMGGIDIVLWFIVGVLPFLLFRRTATQTMNSIGANKAFFAFRQVRPFDAAFVRAGLEAFLMVFIALIIFIGAAFTGRDLLPRNILLVSAAVWGVWLFGLGYGLVASVMIKLIPEMKHVFQILMMPLYILSGVLIPIFSIPRPYRDWLLFNPLVHGLENARLGFFTNYHTVEVSLGYLYLWVVVSICLGLALYRAYETRLVMQ
jgi:capsular polysaccharide transport system permease protein